MKRLLSFIAVAALTVPALARDYAEPAKPSVENPTGSVLTSGQEYLIYNVGLQEYVTSGNAWATQISTAADPKVVFTVTADGDYYTVNLNGSYTFSGQAPAGYGGYPINDKVIANTFLFWNGDEGFCDYSNFGSTTWKFTATGANNAYYWQTSAAENAKYLVAGANAGDAVVFSTDNSSDKAQWLFVSAEAMSTYNALKALYDAIEDAASKGINVETAKSVYQNDASTVDQLNATAAELQKKAAGAISANVQTTIGWATATVSNCQSENGGNNIGYTGAQSVATLDIVNGASGQSYLMEFYTGADNCSAVLTVTLKNSSDEVVAQQDVEVPNIGKWDLQTRHALLFSNLAAGEYKLSIATKSNEGSFAGNWGKPTFAKLTTLAANTSLNWNDAVRAYCQIENGGANIGSTGAETSAVFYINAAAGNYIMNFNTGAAGCSATITATLTDLGGTTVKTQDFTVTDIGTWDRNTVHHLLLDDLAEGTYKLTFATKSIATGSYAGNWGDLTLSKLTDLPATIDLNSGVYSPTGSWDNIHVENNANVGFVKNGATAKYYINNPANFGYSLSIAISKQGQGGSMVATIANAETGATEYTSEVLAINADNSDYNTQTFEISTLTAGAKVLTLTFTADHNDWICNYKDIQFTKLAALALDENNMPELKAATRDVTLTRSIAANQWSTIVLPFSMTYDQLKEAFGSDMKLKQMTAATAESVTLSDATGLNANEPYLIRVSSDFTSATIDGVTIVPSADPKKTIGDVTFQGTYSSMNIPAGAFFLYDNQLYKATGEGTPNTIAPMRGYFTVADGGNARLRITFDDSETTAVQSVATESQQTEQVFDLQGRRVIAPAKGLYIVNGKKVVMK